MSDMDKPEALEPEVPAPAVEEPVVEAPPIQEAAAAQETAPTARVKPRTSVVFFNLGFVTPWILGFAGLSWPDAANSTTIALVVVAIFMVVCFILMGVGRSRDMVDLASYGKGGVWGSAALMLLALLVVGACLVTVGSLFGQR